MPQATTRTGGLASAIKQTAGEGKSTWSTQDQAELLKNLLPSVVGENGEPVALSADQIDILNLIFAPDRDIQNRLLSRVFAEAGYELTDKAKTEFGLMFSAATFGEYLAKTNDPATGRRFVTKVKKLAKKNAFDALFVEAMPAPQATAATPAAAATSEAATPEAAVPGQAAA